MLLKPHSGAAFALGTCLLIAPLGAAWAGKVDICHIPPGNPENLKIRSVGARAAARHIARHGDYEVGPELCDGRDNDCDLLVDEDFPDLGEACSAGVGACERAGVRACAADATGTICDAVPGEPGVEAGACSDQIDNDCDGTVDCDDPDDCSFVSACTGCESERVPLDASGRLVHGDASPLAIPDPGCGELAYGYYANEGPTNAVHILPDFSYAGYMKGGVPIPDVPVVRTVDLPPGEPGDNWRRIQDAIDKVSERPPDANGFRGALLLPRGRWEVDAQLRIAADGVVLRGEGQGVDGTVLVATGPGPEEPGGSRAAGWFIFVGGKGTTFEQPKSGSPIAPITSALVPVGSRTFDVASVEGFAVGDTIGIRRTPNATWFDDIGMAEEPFDWDAGYFDDAEPPDDQDPPYQITHERTIVDIAGNTITVDIPLVDTIEGQYGGGEVFIGDPLSRTRQVGIEDLRIESEYASDTDEDHPWTAVTLERTSHSWVRRVTTRHFAMSAVRMEWASFNTVEDVAFLDPKSLVTGGRRYPFHAYLGLGNLFQRCFARDARHSFATSAKVTGPNVWLDCLAIQPRQNEGPHAMWATGQLFDNTRSGAFDAKKRQNGAGWTGAQSLFWNIYAQPLGWIQTEPPATTGVQCDAPVGAMNWAVGVTGEKVESTEDPPGLWESEGVRVEPRSLYLKQLEDRLGPEAVEAVTTPEQRDGTIWRKLRGWAGEGSLASLTEPYMECEELGGVQAGGPACCAASCDTCGGLGCHLRPGGPEACCGTDIRDAGLSCIDYPAPCVMP